MYVIHKPSNLITEEAQLEEAKQKDIADARAAQKITFRIRLTIGGPDLQVTCKDTTTMGQIKRRIDKMKQISVARQTIVYQGRTCPDDFSLRALNISPDTVVQIMVKSAPTTQLSPTPPDAPSKANPPPPSSSSSSSSSASSSSEEGSSAPADSPTTSPGPSISPAPTPTAHVP